MQQFTKENATHWAKGKIANDISQCSFFHLLSLPKEKYLYIVYEVVCLCHIPSKQCFEEMRFFKEVQFSLHSIHFNQKSCCHLQAGGCFWASQMYFQEYFFCEGWIFLICVIYDVYCVLKYSIPILFLYHGNIPSGRCCFLQKLNT